MRRSTMLLTVRVLRLFAANLKFYEHSLSNCCLRQHRSRSAADAGTRRVAHTGPALKNEMMLPAVLDPWAGHAR
jgi:hypothetical protein